MSGCFADRVCPISVRGRVSGKSVSCFGGGDRIAARDRPGSGNPNERQHDKALREAEALPVVSSPITNAGRAGGRKGDRRYA